MAIFKTDQITSDGHHYHLEDYREQKQQYIKDVEQKAAELIEDARQKAKGIIQQAYKKGLEKADEELARVRAEEEKKGYDEGLKKGEAEVKQRLEQDNKNKLDPLLQQLKQVLDALNQKKEGMFVEAESQLIKTAFDLAQAVIRVEVEQNQDILKEKLKKALSHLHSSMCIEVRINPEDLTLAQTMMPNLQEAFGSTSTVTWREDAEIERASIVVTSGQSQVDLRSELQWQQLLEEMKDKGVS